MRAELFHTAHAAIYRILDPLLLAGSALAAWMLRNREWPEDQLWLPFAAILALAPLALGYSGAYRALRSPRLRDWWAPLGVGMVLLWGLLLTLAFLTKTSALYSRSAFATWAVAGPALLALTRLAGYLITQGIQARRGGLERVVLAGDPEQCAAFAEHIAANAWTGLRAVGLACRPAADTLAGLTADIQVRSLAELPALVRERSADRVCICTPDSDDPIVTEVIDLLRDLPVGLQYAPDYSHMAIFSLRASDLAGRVVIDLSANPMDDRAMIVKWCEDKLLAILVLVLVGPLMLLIALALKCTSRGPVIFGQRRHGLHGRVFTMYKFRSMRLDAGESQSDLEEPTPPEGTPFRPAVSDDPRVTRLGRFLRRTSLDELPQFWNVLKGDMSVVGPRPHAVEHNAQFAHSLETLMRRHYVKPGITGLAQISGARGRADDTASMRRRLDWDLHYIRNWSLMLDCKIMIRTLVVGVFNGQP